MQKRFSTRRLLSERLSLLQKLTKDGLYHVNTLWLFTVNDLKTMVFPSTCFALSTGLAALHAQNDLSNEHIFQLLSQLPWTLLWLWTNLLAFTVANQKCPRGVEEDRLNKPWRPIPSKRLTMETAEIIGKFTYPITLIISSALGGLVPCSLLAIFGCLYNDLRGDEHWLIRNLLNAGGFTSFAAGALEVTTQSKPGDVEIRWLAVIAMLVLTTVHAQDMYDQVGDAAAGRKTIPLIIGDGPARWTIAVGVCFWSVLCPMFWEASANCYVLTMTLGTIVALRSLTKRTVEQDRSTFKIYNVWLMALYLLPALQVQPATAG